MAHLTERQRVRLSERRHGFNTNIRTANWAAQASPARASLMRSVRLPDPTLASVAEETSPPPQFQHQPTPQRQVQPQPQSEPQSQPQPVQIQPQAEEEAAVEMDDGGTEPYFSDHDAQDIDDSLFSHSEQVVILNLHQENAEIRAQLNEAQRQIRLLRRLHRTQAELDGLSGRYWRSPASR